MIHVTRYLDVRCDMDDCDECGDYPFTNSQAETRAAAAKDGWVRARNAATRKLMDVCPRCARKHGLTEQGATK